ncbi:MAG TPA: UDP-N-acetylglucosamine 2-epimerase (non-hydrolyzing) [Azospirillaceae bacterium]|nr:UDP-N-acetylglucosamine 2-epimerase (non-hydrolyzing) [Azospirillaceae bacterium]
MTKSRVLIVIGTRPEAIKLAPVADALSRCGLEPRVCLSGQHRELLAQALEAFDLPIHHNLDLMRDDQDLPALTGRVVAETARVIDAERPDWVIVQGDTVTAMAAALAGFQCGVPVAHVEAGLRSGDLRHPWPEEMNRRLIGQLAALHFAPTEGARRHLLAEGVAPAAIHVTGNTVIDALAMARARLKQRPELGAGAPPDLGADGRAVVLVTVHRRENLGEILPRIGAALERLADRGDCELVFPAHPNPQVSALARRLADRTAGGLRVVPPLSYLPFVALLDRADLILTDSGGIQEEASALGKPVLLLRERTERPEAVEAGNVRLVGADPDRIAAAAARLLDDPNERARASRRHDSFGDGRAAERIAGLLKIACAAGTPKAACAAGTPKAACAAGISPLAMAEETA